MAGLITEHIEIVQGAGGAKACIAGHRIRVQDVAVWHEKLGLSPDEIVEQHPELSLADVHAALTYYWDHRDEVEQAITAEHSFVEAFRKSSPSLLAERAPRQRG